MFIHQGQTRTLKHNLQIASLLSFVAGIVNVAGFLSIQRLTTNVTGHFAFFVEEILQLKWLDSFIYFLYIFFFFFGSFVSSFLIEVFAKKGDRYTYLFPAIIESLILLSIGTLGNNIVTTFPNAIAFGLLFAMGLQNSFVTKISNASVRTTHLTGLFTDLGIELSQLFFYKQPEVRSKIIASVKLRLIIINFFFIGGIIGGVLYLEIGMRVLIIASGILILGMIYDHISFKQNSN